MPRVKNKVKVEAIKDSGKSKGSKGEQGKSVKKKDTKDTKEQEGTAKRPAACAAEKYTYGYSKTTRQAYRTKEGSTASRNHKDIAVDIEVPEGSKPTDPPVAKFSDGSRWPVAGLTCEEWQALQKGIAVDGIDAHHSKRGKKPRAAPDLWNGSCTAGNLRVAYRKDRSMLISLYLTRNNGKETQICQVKLDAVSKEGESAENVKKMAVEVMVKVATALQDGKVEQDQLFEERDKHLAEFGLTVAAAASKKRPASTISGQKDEPAAAAKRPAAASDLVKRPAAAPEVAPEDHEDEEDADDDDSDEEKDNPAAGIAGTGGTATMDFKGALDFDEFM